MLLAAQFQSPFESLYQWRRTSIRSGETILELFLKDVPLPFLSLEKSHHPSINRRLNTMAARVASLVKRSKNKVKDELEGKLT